MQRAGRVIGGAAGFIGRLNPREKALLLVMATIFAVLIVATFFIRYQRSLTKLEEEISSFEAAIEALSTQGREFSQRIRQAEDIERKLRENEVQLHSFLERLCINFSVPPPSSYNDTTQPLRDARTGQARITEISTIADITAVDPLPLSRLLHGIATSGELVVLKAIEVQPARGQPDLYRVRLTLSTFREDRDSRESR
ncbi:MAG: hypothetical protein JW797_10635 [Bradymonadales bacterium]|nr:hypothetical protein [Bradymonadales bacterium]